MEVGKRDFMHNVSKYLDVASKEKVVITHRGKPVIEVKPIIFKHQIQELHGKYKAKVIDNINEHVLPALDI